MLYSSSKRWQKLHVSPFWHVLGILRFWSPGKAPQPPRKAITPVMDVLIHKCTRGLVLQQVMNHVAFWNLLQRLMEHVVLSSWSLLMMLLMAWKRAGIGWVYIEGFDCAYSYITRLSRIEKTTQSLKWAWGSKKRTPIAVQIAVERHWRPEWFVLAGLEPKHGQNRTGSLKWW